MHPIVLPVFMFSSVALFAALFAFDVHRTRAHPNRPQRMYSELAFKGFLAACAAVFGGALVLRAVRLLQTEPTTALLAIGGGGGTLGAFLWLAASGEKSADVEYVPAFVTCDGEFVAAPGAASPLAAWCGWVRFEGHGTCRIQKSAADFDAGFTAEWRAQAGTVRILLPSSRPVGACAELFVRGTEEDEVIDVSTTADFAAPCRYTFAGEEMAHEKVR
jgi:hypothetical protein